MFGESRALFRGWVDLLGVRISIKNLFHPHIRYSMLMNILETQMEFHFRVSSWHTPAGRRVERG